MTASDLPLELDPVFLVIDQSSPPHLWGIFSNGYANSLWKRPLCGINPQWQRVECPPELEF